MNSENLYWRRKRRYLLRCLKESGSSSTLEDILHSPLCAECGGYCCEKHPCSLLDVDVRRINKKSVEALLETGVITISRDFLTRMDVLYVIRPMAYSDQGHISSNNMRKDGLSGRCRLHDKESGCMLSHVYRPSSGLLLIPGRHCLSALDDEHLIGSWGSYQPLLKKLYLKNENVVVPDGDKQASEEQVSQLTKVMLGRKFSCLQKSTIVL